METQFTSRYWREWTRKKRPPTFNEKCKTFNIVDLFSGCGGMTLGVVEAARAEGYKVKVSLAADTFREAAEVYKLNFGHLINDFISTDISAIFPPNGISKTKDQIKLVDDKIDLLLAGPPCQGHSNLNNSTRRNDPRNQLYLSAITAVEELAPTMCVIENVPAIVHDKKFVTENSIKRLRAAGYFIEELIVQMAELGLPQTRKRHLLVGHKEVQTCIFSEILKNPLKTSTLRDYVMDLEKIWQSRDSIFDTPSKANAENSNRINILFDKQLYDLPNSDRPSCHKEKSHSYKSSYGRLNWDLPAQTITSGFGSMGQGRYVHPSQRRTITPHEAARIQGFPDFFSFASVTKRTALQEMIANAVPPPAIAIIARYLLNSKNSRRGT